MNSSSEFGEFMFKTPSKILRLHRSMYVLIFLAGTCSISLAFHQPLWVEASRFPKACVSERQAFLISWFSMMTLYRFFQLYKIIKGHSSFRMIITTYNLWIFICLFSSCIKWPATCKHLPRCWFNFLPDGMSSLWATISINTEDDTTKCIVLVVLEMHCMSYWILWKRSRIDIFCTSSCWSCWWPR